MICILLGLNIYIALPVVQDPAENVGKAQVDKRRNFHENVTGHVGRTRDDIDYHFAAL